MAPFTGQVGQQAQTHLPTDIPLQYFGVLEVKAFLYQRIERLEQAFLDREGQGHQQGDLFGGSCGHALHLGRSQDFAGQSLGPVCAQQVFQVHAQALPVGFRRNDGGGPAGAVGDGTGDMGRPDRRTVFTDGRNAVGTVQLPQGGAGTEAPGEKLGLAFGHRALNTRRRFDAATLEIVRGELRRTEPGAEQYAMRHGLGQRPMGVEGRAANG